jgi:hypothetical protein
LKILEQQLVGKRGSDELCEDGLFCNEHFAAVVDGCTSHQKLDGIEERGGLIAKRCILQALACLNGSETKVEVFRSLNASILDWYRQKGFEEQAYANPNMRCSAYVAMVSINRREVWVLGDCQALYGKTLLTRHKAIDTLMEQVRVFLVEQALVTGHTRQKLLDNPEYIQTQLESLMQKQPSFQNIKGDYRYSYTVIDGFFSSYDEILHEKLPATPIEVVLASDGYPRIFPTLAESEAALEQQLANDPLMVETHCATKPLLPGNVSFDDRSFLRLRI